MIQFQYMKKYIIRSLAGSALALLLLFTCIPLDTQAQTKNQIKGIGGFSSGAPKIPQPSKITKPVVTPVSPTLTVSPLSRPIESALHVADLRGLKQTLFTGFTLSATGATSTAKTVTIKIQRAGSSTLPTAVYLVNGSGSISRKKDVINDTKITFDTAELNIVKNGKADFFILADLPPSTVSTSTVSIDIVDVAVSAGTVVRTALPIIGKPMFFVRPAPVQGVAEYTPAQPSIVVKNPSQIGDRPVVVATFPLEVTALNGNISQPKPSDFGVIFFLGSSTVASTSVSVTTIPNNPNGIAQDAKASVTVTAMLTGPQLKSGLYAAKLVNIRTTNGLTDVLTPYSAPVVVLSRSGIGMLTASIGTAFRTVFGGVTSLFGY